MAMNPGRSVLSWSQNSPFFREQVAVPSPSHSFRLTSSTPLAGWSFWSVHLQRIWGSWVEIEAQRQRRQTRGMHWKLGSSEKPARPRSPHWDSHSYYSKACTERSATRDSSSKGSSPASKQAEVQRKKWKWFVQDIPDYSPPSSFGSQTC